MTCREKDNVLIVDDSPLNLYVLEELLKELKQFKKIDRAQNGEEAVNLVKQDLGRRCRYKAILMDLNMPIKDGFQATKELRDLNEQGEINLSNTIIVAISSITRDRFNETEGCSLFD